MSHPLTEWWLNAFTPAERAMIAERFRPMGSVTTYLSQNEVVATPGCADAVSFLTTLAGWFQSTQERHLAMIMLAKAEQLVAEGATANILDLHFLYMTEIQTNYRDRDLQPEALDAAIRACYSQIGISRKAKTEMLQKFGDFMPSHTGFKQLAIIREKQGGYDESIKLCIRAKEEGWMGDWDARIARCRTKLKKSNRMADR